MSLLKKIFGASVQHVPSPSIKIEQVPYDGEGPAPVKPEPVTRPACMQFDDTETTEFGRQVAMLLALSPATFNIHSSLRFFHHAELGLFEFDEADRLQHQGPAHNQFSIPNQTQAGRQRALSRGDHDEIVAALRTLLTASMEIGIPVQVDGSVNLFHGPVLPDVGKKGDLFKHTNGDYSRHNGERWVPMQEQAPHVAAGAITSLQAMQQQMDRSTQRMLEQQYEAMKNDLRAMPPHLLLGVDTLDAMQYLKGRAPPPNGLKKLNPFE